MIYTEDERVAWNIGWRTRFSPRIFPTFLIQNTPSLLDRRRAIDIYEQNLLSLLRITSPCLATARCELVERGYNTL